jgi:hypothetical protein
MLLVLAFVLILPLVLLPVGLFLKNQREFLPPCSDPESLELANHEPVSVCIPARNEERSIAKSLEALLKSSHAQFEVLVLDDHSEDRTAQIVRSFSEKHPNVRLLQSSPLPSGWNGKQHACWQLAGHAQYSTLLFLDSDVRVTPDALTRCVAEQQSRKASLVSGFPLQETGTIAEKMLIPMMHYILLCYLPLDQMRSSTKPEFAAGCGQLFVAQKDSYFSCGGHEAIQGSRHDGIQLPRTFRKHGFQTDLFDATGIARCRMYETTTQVVRGLLKNATEGIANAKLIVPFSILLIGGNWMPIVLLIVAWYSKASVYFLGCILLAVFMTWIPRLIAARRFKQSVLGAILHPFAIAVFVALQWVAWVQKQMGLQVTWRGRI